MNTNIKYRLLDALTGLMAFSGMLWSMYLLYLSWFEQEDLSNYPLSLLAVLILLGSGVYGQINVRKARESN